MKKLTTILAAIVLLFNMSAFAIPAPAEPVTEAIQLAFKKNFSDAGAVTWEKTGGYFFANFQIGSHNVNAAYTEEGELLGVARKIELAQLPMNITQALKNQFGDYQLRSYATEILFDGETNYYLTAEGNSRTFYLKCDASGHISIEKTIKKKILVGRVM